MSTLADKAFGVYDNGIGAHRVVVAPGWRCLRSPAARSRRRRWASRVGPPPEPCRRSASSTASVDAVSEIAGGTDGRSGSAQPDNATQTTAAAVTARAGAAKTRALTRKSTAGNRILPTANRSRAVGAGRVIAIRSGVCAAAPTQYPRHARPISGLRLRPGADRPATPRSRNRATRRA